MIKLTIFAKRKNEKIGVLWKVTSMWPILLFVFKKAFHNILYLPDRRTASDLYQSYVGRYTGLTSECWHRSDIKMAYLACRCRCKNDISIRDQMVDVVSATDFHRLDNRTASDRYQSYIGRYNGAALVCRCRNHIKMTHLPWLGYVEIWYLFAVELSTSFWQPLTYQLITE